MFCTCTLFCWTVETKRLKHSQSSMVAGMQDASFHVVFLVSVGGKWQFVVSTGRILQRFIGLVEYTYCKKIYAYWSVISLWHACFYLALWSAVLYLTTILQFQILQELLEVIRLSVFALSFQPWYWVHKCRLCLFIFQLFNLTCNKGKVLPYLLPSVGPGADPSVQAVSHGLLLKSSPSDRLPLLSARPAVTFPAEERHHPSTGTKLYCLVKETHRYEQLAQGCYYADGHGETRTYDPNDLKSNTLPLSHLPFSMQVITIKFCVYIGLYHQRKCPKGRHCNFLHVFRNPGDEFRNADAIINRALVNHVSEHRRSRSPNRSYHRYSRSRRRSRSRSN